MPEAGEADSWLGSMVELMTMAPWDVRTHPVCNKVRTCYGEVPRALFLLGLEVRRAGGTSPSEQRRELGTPEETNQTFVGMRWISCYETKHPIVNRCEFAAVKFWCPLRSGD